jgi:FkbM family methyltransferase
MAAYHHWSFLPSFLTDHPPTHPIIIITYSGDCNEEIESEVQSSSGGVTVYCLEPSQANFAQLILTRDKFFGTQTTTTKNVHWLTVNAAASNQTAVSHFARGCTSEQCALNLKSPLYDLIDTTTVDAFILKHEIPYVDILKIDTEGYDATVIQGAMQSIASGKVGVITFEYHEVGVWKEYKLRDVVDWLNGLNYVCYFDGKPSLARMTGCWDDAYEIYSWSNVVCVKRSDPLYAAMEKMALRHEEYPGSYFKAMSE